MMFYWRICNFRKFHFWSANVGIFPQISRHTVFSATNQLLYTIFSKFYIFIFQEGFQPEQARREFHSLLLSIFARCCLRREHYTVWCENYLKIIFFLFLIICFVFVVFQRSKASNVFAAEAVTRQLRVGPMHEGKKKKKKSDFFWKNKN